MNRMNILVGRGSRTSQDHLGGITLSLMLTLVRPRCLPSRARRFANTHSSHGTLQTTARPPSRPKTSFDLTRHKPCKSVGSCRSLALPPSRPKTSFDLTRHKPCKSAGSFGSLALPVSRPKTFLDLTRQQPCETGGPFWSLAYPIGYELK
jgi:hypothetical protein